MSVRAVGAPASSRQPLVFAFLLIAQQALLAQALPVNVIANPSFELAEPPVPSPTLRGQPAPSDQWRPQTWSVWPLEFDGYRLVDDPARAHTGRRCVHVTSTGGVLSLRYGPVPRFDGKPWTVRFWARGAGQWQALAEELLYAHGPRVLQQWSFPATAQWTECSFQYSPTPDLTSWHLDLRNQGAGDLWLDDVFIGHPDLQPLGLPPTGPLGKDEHTLLYLPFEEPLDEYKFYTRGQVSLSAPDAGRFGRSLVLGADGYVACSATRHLDPQQGTIELWVKPGFAGNDGVTHSFLSIWGPEGMQLCQHQFPHVMFSFTSGFGMISSAWAETYAQYWQPGVWRHLAVCWDKDLVQLFIEGKLVAWEIKPQLLRVTGDELGIGSAGMELDDLRISNIVRYRSPVRLDGPRRNESFIGGAGKY